MTDKNTKDYIALIEMEKQQLSEAIKQLQEKNKQLQEKNKQLQENNKQLPNVVMNDAVKRTFDILKEKYGVDHDFLYKNAETKDSFNISLQGLCDKLGIKIIVKNDLTDENGRMISGAHDCKNRIIYINGSDIGERMSFTLGHELYYILNYQNEES